MSEGDRFIGMTLAQIADEHRRHVAFGDPSAQFLPHPASIVGVHALDLPLEPFTAIREELERASVWPPFNSMHEAKGVIEEEFDEFWDHVKTNQKRRDLPAMRAELVQLAAMAIKAIECIDMGRGRV